MASINVLSIGVNLTNCVSKILMSKIKWIGSSLQLLEKNFPITTLYYIQFQLYFKVINGCVHSYASFIYITFSTWTPSMAFTLLPTCITWSDSWRLLWTSFTLRWGYLFVATKCCQDSWYYTKLTAVKQVLFLVFYFAW